MSAVSKQDITLDKSNDNIRKTRKVRRKRSNKRKGTDFEYRVKAYYVRRGYIVLRARGSLGPADLICLKEGERDIFVQCKDINTNYFDKHEMSDFTSFCQRHSRRCVWAYNYHDPTKKKGRMKFINLLTTPVHMVTKAFVSKPQQNCY